MLAWKIQWNYESSDLVDKYEKKLMSPNNSFKRPPVSEELTRRWGNAVIKDGFQAVPHRLLRHQADLRITDQELVVLLNVLDFWWATERRPFPGAASISHRIGSAERTVRRHMRALEKKGYVVKRKQEQGDKSEFDFTGLIHKLATLVDGNKNN